MKTKHCFQRFAAALACLMLCMLCMPHVAHAKGYNKLPVEGTPCSIELSYRVDGVPVAGMEYRLYRVASMDKNVQLTLTDGFARLQPLQADGMDLRNLPASLNTTWTALAETLYQNLGGLRPDATAVTGETGIARAENLEMGLWLVVGQTHSVAAEDGTETYYRPVPFLVALPSWVENSWDYDVSVASKPMASLTARRVLKVWDDRGGQSLEHPDIVVQLMRNGVDYGDPVTLNAGNNWRHDFGELENSDGTNPINWTIREVTDLGRGYTVSISQQGITWVVTNTYNPPPPPPSIETPSPEPSATPSTEPSPGPSTEPSPGPSTEPGPGPSTEPGPVPSSSPSPAPSPSPEPGEPNEPDEPPEEFDEPDVPLTDLPDEPGVPLGRPEDGPDEPDESQEPEEPPEEFDDPDVPLGNLPQTGQLWWPVPVLATAGAVMLLFGLKRRRSANYEE